ncbi:MAG: cyclase family protein, partial [Acidimicrobiales bacterium]
MHSPARRRSPPRRATAACAISPGRFSPSFPVCVDGEEATRSTHVTIEEDGYYLQRWTFYEHTATHMDAPGHFAPSGRLSPDIGLDELLVPAVVI